MRIPTYNLYAQELFSVSQQYLGLNNLYQQADTQQKLLEPSDDPVLASRISLTSNYIDELASYSQNATLAKNRMQTFSSSISGAVSYVGDIQSLIQNAQNGTNTDDERQAIALQLNGYLNNLLTTASAQDGSGGYIYSGSYTNTQPFVLQNGEYDYQGSFDTTSINIGPGSSVIYNEVGYNVFGNIPQGNGTFTVTASDTNTGTATTTAGNVVSTSGYVPDVYTITFMKNASDQTVYTISGQTSGQVIPPPPATIPDDAPAYTPGPNGMDITFNGMSLSVRGNPSAGDSFQVEPSQGQNIFNSLQNLINVLQTPTNGNPVAIAQLQQTLSQAASTFSNAYSQMVSYQSEFGTRGSTVNSQTQLNASLTSSETDILIDLSIADPFEVVSSITQQKTYLEISLDAYKQMQDVLKAIMQT